MENSSNLISVYIPTKNRINLLKRAVDSVLNQSYKNWELVIVNDASTDETYDYLERIKSKKIKVIHQKYSQGACVARNLALKISSGYFITGLDDDDYFEVNRLGLFLEAWKNKTNNTVLLFSGMKEVNLFNQIINLKKAKLNFYTQNDLLVENFVGNQVFTTLDFMKGNAGFDEKLKMWQDLDFWYRLLKHGVAMRLDNESYCVDVSDREDRITTSKKEKVMETFNYLCKKYNLTLFERELFSIHIIAYKSSIILKFKKILLLLISGKYFKYYL